MKKIIGKLPVNQKYEVIAIDYVSLEEGGGGCCDNCGKIISNIATIKNEAGQLYSVGLDCAGTMSLYQNNQVFNLIETKKILARRARLVKWIKTEFKGGVISLAGKNSKWSDEILLYKRPATKWSSGYIYRLGLKYFKKTYSPNIVDYVLKNSITETKGN